MVSFDVIYSTGLTTKSGDNNKAKAQHLRVLRYAVISELVFFLEWGELDAAAANEHIVQFA